MEDGDAAKGSAGPLGEVSGEVWVEGLEEGACEGDLEGRACEGGFADLVEYLGVELLALWQGEGGFNWVV